MGYSNTKTQTTITRRFFKNTDSASKELSTPILQESDHDLIHLVITAIFGLLYIFLIFVRLPSSDSRPSPTPATLRSYNGLITSILSLGSQEKALEWQLRAKPIEVLNLR